MLYTHLRFDFPELFTRFFFAIANSTETRQTITKNLRILESPYVQRCEDSTTCLV